MSVETDSQQTKLNPLSNMLETQNSLEEMPGMI